MVWTAGFVITRLWVPVLSPVHRSWECECDLTWVWRHNSVFAAIFARKFSTTQLLRITRCEYVTSTFLSHSQEVLTRLYTIASKANANNAILVNVLLLFLLSRSLVQLVTSHRLMKKGETISSSERSVKVRGENWCHCFSVLNWSVSRCYKVLKALNVFRIVKDQYSHLVYQSMHKITNLWTFWVSWSSKLQKNKWKKKHPCCTILLCVLSYA